MLSECSFLTIHLLNPPFYFFSFPCLTSADVQLPLSQNSLNGNTPVLWEALLSFYPGLIFVRFLKVKPYSFGRCALIRIKVIYLWVERTLKVLYLGLHIFMAEKLKLREVKWLFEIMRPLSGTSDWISFLLTLRLFFLIMSY